MEQSQSGQSPAASLLPADHSGLINPTPPVPTRLIAVPGSLPSLSFQFLSLSRWIVPVRKGVSEPPLAVPLALLESEEIFNAVLSKETWDSLSPEDRARLKASFDAS